MRSNFTGPIIMLRCSHEGDLMANSTPSCRLFHDGRRPHHTATPWLYREFSWSSVSLRLLMEKMQIKITLDRIIKEKKIQQQGNISVEQFQGIGGLSVPPNHGRSQKFPHLSRKRWSQSRPSFHSSGQPQTRPEGFHANFNSKKRKKKHENHTG